MKVPRPADLYESLLATLDVLSDPDAMRAIRSSRSRKRKTHSLKEIDRLIRQSIPAEPDRR